MTPVELEILGSKGRENKQVVYYRVREILPASFAGGVAVVIG